MDVTQTTLLRVAAFLVDAVSISILLILPASLISYGLAWFGGAVQGIAIGWAVAVSILFLGPLPPQGHPRRPPRRRNPRPPPVRPPTDRCTLPPPPFPPLPP